MRVKVALISVSDKSGVVEFARALVDMGVRILSTGGTARHLADAGIPVAAVQDVTGFPEMMEGRVKTLHPHIHGGILARRDVPGDMEDLARHGIEGIDLVAVNLYPFQQAVARPGVTLGEAMEQVDIGGPTMVRAAAKNHASVVVVVNPAHYQEIARELAATGDVADRERLAAEAFAHTAEYDRAIADYFSRSQQAQQTPFPQRLDVAFTKVQDLRYGENPHQAAAFYRDADPEAPSIASAQLLHGKELSFNNVNDAAAALDIACEFDEPVAVAVKHTNPCGVGTGEGLVDAYRRAYDADPVSIFGGIVALNRTVEADVARLLAEIFLEVVIAPDYTEEALQILSQKPALRLLAVGPFAKSASGFDLKRVRGGLLVQERDLSAELPEIWRVVTKVRPPPEQLRDLYFGWRVVKHVKSNAVLLVRDRQTVGVGAGQMNRILPTRMSIEQAKERAKGSALASDAFFPFDDVVKAAAEAGVTAIVQPGGSKRDEDSIVAADAAGITMLFTGVRHFKH